MIRSPWRGTVEGVGSTVYDTTVDPLPFDAEVTWSHDSSSTRACHPQLSPTASSTAPAPPDDPTLVSRAERTGVHGAAACVTTRSDEPTVTCPERGRLSTFCSAVNVAYADPEAPGCSHPTSATARQPQPLASFTLICTTPPAGFTADGS